MGDVTQNRRTALLAERSAAQAHRAAAAGQQNAAAAPQAPQSTVGKAIGAANKALAVYGDVMGAYGKVMGFTGDLAEKAVVAVFSKLSFMQGLACLPASSQLDPVLGIDVHLVMIPPSPSPIPMPHPYIAMVFNPKDFVACAVNTVTAAIPPPPPDSAGLQLASTVGNMAKGMIMGKLGLSATVKLGAVTPRTQSGTKNKSIPHFPMGASFAPTPILKDSGEAFFGALLVLADGEPFSAMMHLNYNCWDIGIKALSRKGGDPDAQHLYMPTGFIMAIPSHNVIVSPIPTPINPIAALTKVLNFGLAKLLHGITKFLPAGLRNALAKAICHVTGHPVDVVSGILFTEEEDFSLPGMIPFSWERTWYSDSSYRGPLGHGWYHSYDICFAIDQQNNRAIYRLNDGRGLTFELPQPGKFTFDRNERLFLHRDSGNNYYVKDRNDLIYRFTKNVYANEYSNTKYQLISSISDQNGYAIKFEYDFKGRLIKITDSAGRILTVENDACGRIISILAPDPDNKSKTFSIAAYEYDESGNMICHTDALTQKMRYEYEQHLLAKETWRNGQKWYFEYDGKTIGSKCIHTWGDGDLYNHKLTYLRELTIVENSLGRISTCYHINGLVARKIDAKGAEWNYRYNKYHELEWETDPLGNQYSFAHDEWGNIVASTDPEGGFFYTEFYNPKFPFLPTEEMTAAGGKYKWEYDNEGNLTREIDPLGAETKYEYNYGLLTAIINPFGAITTLKYDDEQNVSSITEDETETKYIFDNLGRCITKINHNDIRQYRRLDLKNNFIYVRDFDNNVIEMAYDGLGNITVYSDKQTDISYAYNGMGKCIIRTEGDASIRFRYDTEEQLFEVINEQGLRYKFELDEVGNVISETGFDDIKHHYFRNPLGWPTKIERPGGKVTLFNYDNCGRPVKVENSDGSIETYAYKPDGSLIKAVNENAIVEFERDVVGNVIKEITNGEWIASEFDIMGNRIKTTSSLGAAIFQQYNKFGGLSQTEANEWNAKYELDKFGLELSRFLPGGIRSKWQRDGMGRPIFHSIDHVPTSQTKSYKKYLWEVNDRLQQITDNKLVTKFQYDKWDNLSKTIFSDGEIQYRNPDAVGNLFKTENRSDRLYSKGGQLKKSGQWEYNYDLEGNLIKKNSVSTKSVGEYWDFEWNAAGKLVKVIRPDKSEVEFAYDALGRRLWKKFKNTITKFVWDGHFYLHEWKENANTGEKLSSSKVDPDGIITWVYDENSFVPAAKIKGNKRYSIITDHIGTPSQMYKENGELFWDCELDSYGKIRMEKGELGSCPFRYQGQYEDIETGLYFNYFRYYAPDEGIYISQDPIGLSGGSALYNYVDDPNTWTDEFGLSSGSGALDRALKGKPGDGKQAHHLIPEEVWGKNKPFLDEIGLKGQRDKKSNGILMPSSRGKAQPGEIIHRGSHPEYSDRVNKRLTNIRNQYKNGEINKKQARKKVKALQASLRRQIKSGAGVPTKTCSGGVSKQKLA